MNIPEAEQIIKAGAADMFHVVEALQAAMDQTESSYTAVSPTLEIIHHSDLSEGWELTNQLKEEIEPLLEKAQRARVLLLRSVGEAP